MPVKHGSYPWLMVYNGTLGESPVPGAFYATKAEDTLAGTKSGVAKRAYGDYKLWRMINSNAWNVRNVYHYTNSSCKSGDRQPLGSTVGDIIICKQAGQYPTIWVPPITGETPEELEPKADDAKPAFKPMVVVPITPFRPYVPVTPVKPVVLPGGGKGMVVISPGGSGKVTPGAPGRNTAGVVPQGGSKSWLIVGGLLVGAGVLYLLFGGKKRRHAA